MENTTQHILIVDDVLKNLQLTAQIIKEAGYSFSLAQNGESALKFLEHEIPNLILLDIMMPGIDGLELCRQIKQNDRLSEIPVIFLTAKNQTDDLVQGFKAGGVDYISKPFNREELLIRVKTHLELSNSRKKILEMNLTRDKLYSIIAHDIRSPLSSISFTISAISNGDLNPCSSDFKDVVNELDKTTHETTTLLNNLLKWTNLQSNGLELSFKVINIFDVISDCKQLLEGNANNKKILFNLNLATTIEAYADEVTIHTVFRNLISNAIKFTPEGGSIDFDAEYEDNYTTISVKDTGVGMPYDIIHKIFDNNEHFTSQGTNNEHGSGLGLYLVKDFVDKNHGKIAVSSIPGSGTEITIYLPTGNK